MGNRTCIVTDGLVKGSGSHTGPYAERTPQGPRRIRTISGPGLGKRKLENSNLGVLMSKMLSSEGPTLWAGIPFLSPLVRSLCHTGHTHSDWHIHSRGRAQGQAPLWSKVWHWRCPGLCVSSWEEHLPVLLVLLSFIFHYICIRPLPFSDSAHGESRLWICLSNTINCANLREANSLHKIYTFF